MANINQKITNCLWFDTEAEKAAQFYVSIFHNSKVGEIARFSKVGYEHHGKAEGEVMMVEFEIAGQQFKALNGGPQFKFNEAISLIVSCDSQEEIDYYWNSLSAGGEECPCGWLKDQFGVSWQIVPARLTEILKDSDSTRFDKVMNVLFQMKKIKLERIEQEYQGNLV